MMRLKTKVFDPSLVQTQMLTSEHFQQADSATQGEADRVFKASSIVYHDAIGATEID